MAFEDDAYIRKQLTDAHRPGDGSGSVTLKVRGNHGESHWLTIPEERYHLVVEAASGQGMTEA